MSKIAPRKWDADKLECFSPSQRAEIENLAVALSDEEIFSYFDITGFDDLPDYDAMFLRVSINRGRLIAKQNACHHLFKAMEGKQGMPAALAYLTRFGHDNWKEGQAGAVGLPKRVSIVIDE